MIERFRDENGNFLEPTKIVLPFYNEAYRNVKNKDDSPSAARDSLIMRAHENIQGLGSSGKILDLGSGKGVFEKEYTEKYGRISSRVIQVDGAYISSYDLLQDGSSFHLRAIGSSLPLLSETIDCAVSNMALDLMPPQAINELSRVLKPRAHVFINFHHTLLTLGLRRIRRDPNSSEGTKRLIRQWEYLDTYNVLYKDQNQIKKELESRGFIVKSLKRNSDERGNDYWWEVDVRNNA